MPYSSARGQDICLKARAAARKPRIRPARISDFAGRGVFGPTPERRQLGGYLRRGRRGTPDSACFVRKTSKGRPEKEDGPTLLSEAIRTLFCCLVISGILLQSAGRPRWAIPAQVAQYQSPERQAASITPG